MAYIGIRTKYLAPTNTLGGRISATTSSGRRYVVGWDHALNVSENHRRAVSYALRMMGKPLNLESAPVEWTDGTMTYMVELP